MEMTCGSCRYSCISEHLGNDSDVCPNADVSGIGVVLGYTINAGIVTGIILFNYLLAFQPEADPFLEDKPGTRPRLGFKPNPIDMLAIKFVREKCGLKHTIGKHVEQALLKSVLSMSDLQILTGLSILISGFIQMRCGITRYHWHILVYLAWFSSLTHFGCLSLLRNYLVNHPGERLWRVVAMASIVIMLITALAPTGLGGNSVRYGDTVVCAFRYTGEDDREFLSFANMVLSIVFLVIGLFMRVFKLSKRFTTSITTQLRDPFGKVATAFLSRIHTWSTTEESHASWKALLVYRPLLAMFLLSRLVLDIYLSMLGEIMWVVINFAWGLIHLIRTRTSVFGGDENWAFGQVVPLILLAAPLITVVEYFNRGGESPSLRATPTSALPTLAQLGMQTETNSSSLTNPFTPCNRNTNDPEHDFYQHTRWFKEFALVPLIVILEFAMYTLLLAAFQDTVFSRLLELPYGIWFWAFVYCPTYGISYILLGFLFSGKVRSPPLRPRVALCLRKFPLVCVVIIITIISPLLDLPPLLGYEFILVVCPPGVYLLLSLISIIHSWVLRRSHGS